MIRIIRYGAGLQGATGQSAGGLYDTANDALGKKKGLRQYYRYGMYSEFGSVYVPYPYLEPVLLREMWSLREWDFAMSPLPFCAGSYPYRILSIVEGCGYQTSGSGICNATTVGYAFEPLSQMLADTPAKFSNQTNAIIPDSTFRDNSYNHDMSRGGSLMILVSGILCRMRDSC